MANDTTLIIQRAERISETEVVANSGPISRKRTAFMTRISYIDKRIGYEEYGANGARDITSELLVHFVVSELVD